MDVQPPRPGPATATLLVHPADRVRASYEERRGCPSCRRASPSRLDAIVTDLDGKAVAGRRHRCAVGAPRLTWEQNHYRTGEVTIQQVRRQRSATTSTAIITCERCTPGDGPGGIYRRSRPRSPTTAAART